MRVRGVRSFASLAAAACIACTTPAAQPSGAFASPAGGPVAGASSTAGASSEESALSARVQAYWKARQRKDLSAMYEMYSEGYRQRHSRDDFLKKTRLVRFDILDFTILQSEIAGDAAAVTVSYRTVAPPKLAEPFASRITDRWVRDPDGRWAKEKETLLLPFVTGGTLREVED